MTMSRKTRSITRIISCEVFKPAIEYFQMAKRYPNLRFSYLPSNLHLRPQELEDRLRKKIISAQKRRERVICLYADCFPDIDDFCQQYGVTKVPGHDCYEMLLGDERFSQLIEETTETYFAEQDLILHFKKYCVRPLELRDEEMRKYYFGRYRRLLYVRQPSDPDIIFQADEVAKFLDLPLDISNVDYTHLEKNLIDLLVSNFYSEG